MSKRWIPMWLLGLVVLLMILATFRSIPDDYIQFRRIVYGEHQGQ